MPTSKFAPCLQGFEAVSVFFASANAASAAGASFFTGRGVDRGGVSATATAQAQKAPFFVSMSVVCLARCPRASAEAFARGARGVFSLRILAEAGCSSQRANRRRGITSTHSALRADLSVREFIACFKR